jgi:ubiquinone/menaquinone biosynthesis C-methylase UbiE
MRITMKDPKAAVREYFDRDVDGYLAAYDRSGSRGEIFRERRRLVLALTRDPVGRVLDVGAGPGVFTTALMRRSGRCVVTDLSAGMLVAARAERARDGILGEVLYVAADAERLGLRDASFDTVLCVGVLQYLLTPHAALAELARVTRGGGQVLLTVPNAGSPLNGLHRAVISAARTSRTGLGRLGIRISVNEGRLTFRDDIPNAAFSLARVEKTARDVGLAVTDVVCHGLHFPFSVPGFGPALGAWNALTRRAPDRVRRRWGRELVLRLTRVN